MRGLALLLALPIEELCVAVSADEKQLMVDFTVIIGTVARTRTLILEDNSVAPSFKHWQDGELEKNLIALE